MQFILLQKLNSIWDECSVFIQIVIFGMHESKAQPKWNSEKAFCNAQCMVQRSIAHQSQHHVNFHFQDGVCTVWLWFAIVANFFVELHAGSILTLCILFHSWCFQHEMPFAFDKILCLVCMPDGMHQMLNHCTLHSSLPLLVGLMLLWLQKMWKQSIMQMVSLMMCRAASWPVAECLVQKVVEQRQLQALFTFWLLPKKC